MNSKKLGLTLFLLGATLMLVVGWLSSWWFVPTIKKLGFENIPVPGFVAVHPSTHLRLAFPAVVLHAQNPFHLIVH